MRRNFFWLLMIVFSQCSPAFSQESAGAGAPSLPGNSSGGAVVAPAEDMSGISSLSTSDLSNIALGSQIIPAVNLVVYSEPKTGIFSVFQSPDKQIDAGSNFILTERLNKQTYTGVSTWVKLQPTSADINSGAFWAKVEDQGILGASPTQMIDWSFVGGDVK